MSEDTGRNREPVFVLAPARSCSSVTVAMMAGHPALYGFPEMLLFTARTVGELLDERDRLPAVLQSRVSVRHSGVLRAVADIRNGEQSDRAVAEARRWLAARREWSTTELMDELLRRVHPRRGIEKSPYTTATDEALGRCLESYPRASYIHLTRHPSGTLSSMREAWRSRYRTVRELTDASAELWYSSHSRIQNALAAMPPRQWTRVRAEDLLRDPRPVLGRILAWLGLPAGELVLTGMLDTARWAFAGAGPTGALGGADHADAAGARPGLLTCRGPRAASGNPDGTGEDPLVR